MKSTVDIFYRRVSEELPISRAAYEETLVGWVLSPIRIDGREVGAMMLREREIHIVVDKPTALRHARRLIKQCLTDNLERYGYLTTISFKEDKYTRFLERLGFYKTGEDATFYYYRIDHARIH